MFKDVFGNSPHTRILDFLADYPRLDYNITELAKKSGVSKPTAYKVIEELLKKKLVIKTREMGNIKLYKLNTENPVVKSILKLDFEIAAMVAELEDSKQVKDAASIFSKQTREKKIPT